MRPAAKVLESLGLVVEMRVLSAHRTPRRRPRSSRTPTSRREGVHLRRGRGAHLAGAVAAHTTRPGHRHPVVSGSLGGLDSLLSTVQMPPGMPVATVAIGGAENAGLLAAQMIGIADAELAKRVEAERAARRKKVLDSDGRGGALKARDSPEPGERTARAHVHGPRLRRGDRLRGSRPASGRDRRPIRRRRSTAWASMPWTSWRWRALRALKGPRRQGDLGAGRRSGDARHSVQRRAAAGDEADAAVLAGRADDRAARAPQSSQRAGHGWMHRGAAVVASHPRTPSSLGLGRPLTTDQREPSRRTSRND
jgi:5-(carboxyamino)imidazole ribonucleotide mutase